mgnify:CR=1 FL=1
MVEILEGSDYNMLPIEIKWPLLTVTANGAPVIAAVVCDAWCHQLVDGGECWQHGRRLAGEGFTPLEGGSGPSFVGIEFRTVLLGQPV